MEDSVNAGPFNAQFITLAITAAGCGIVLFAAWALAARRLRENRPHLKRGGAELVFRGRGAGVTQAVFMEAGAYRLSCQFTGGAAVKIDLIAVDSGERETLLVKSGSGTLAFTLDGGLYVFDVDPADHRSAWNLQVGPLGLPGRREFMTD